MKSFIVGHKILLTFGFLREIRFNFWKTFFVKLNTSSGFFRETDFNFWMFWFFSWNQIIERNIRFFFVKPFWMGLRIFRETDSQCRNYGNLLSFFFGKNFVKVMVLLTKLLNSWFYEFLFIESKFFIFPQSGRKTRICVVWNIFREITIK